MAKNNTNWLAWGLEFVGSLAYLYVVWKLWAGGVGPAGVFGPVLFGLAAVMAVGFFIMTLVALMSPSNDEMMKWTMKTSFVAGFALLALLAPTAATAGWSAWAEVALVGFVLSYVGVGMSKNM